MGEIYVRECNPVENHGAGKPSLYSLEEFNGNVCTMHLLKEQEPRGGNVPDIAFVITSGLQLPIQKIKTQ